MEVGKNIKYYEKMIRLNISVVDEEILPKLKVLIG